MLSKHLMSWDISWNRKLFINIIQWCYEIVTLHTACERWVLKKYLHFSVVKWVLLIGRPLWKPLPPFIPASMKHLSTCSYDKEYMILAFTCISQYSLIVRTGTFLCLAQALYSIHWLNISLINYKNYIILLLKFIFFYYIKNKKIF